VPSSPGSKADGVQCLPGVVRLLFSSGAVAQGVQIVSQSVARCGHGAAAVARASVLYWWRRLARVCLS
jgi:hypothetical protein